MSSLRAMLRHQRLLTMLVIALTLCVKALLPTGYMVAQTTQTLTVTLCTDGSGEHRTLDIAIPQSGNQQQGQQKADGSCAFSATGWAATGDAHAPMLALALLFILALGFAPVAIPRLAPLHFAHPPLRGPPALA